MPLAHDQELPKVPQYLTRSWYAVIQTRHPLTQVIASYLVASRDQMLVIAPETHQINLFKRCFQAEPRAVVEAWLSRNSDFEFMEHNVTPRAPAVASLLVDLLRRAERLCEQITSESDSDRSTLRQVTLSQAEQRLIDELTENTDWLKLIDARALSSTRSQGDEAREVEELTSETRAEADIERERSLHTLVSRSLVMIHEALSAVVHRSVYNDLPYEEGRYSLARALNELGAYISFEQVAELSRSAIERKWALCLDDVWIKRCLNSSELSSALIKLRARWVELWSADSECLGLDSNLSDRERRSLALKVWESVTYSHCMKYARAQLQEMRAADITRDLCVSFEALIDKKRPKAQQLGVFMMNPEDAAQIDIVFMTRDGRYLAQRTLEWDPTDQATIAEAFSHINVSTLICATETRERFPKALELLSERYNLRQICDSAFETPADGSPGAVKDFLMTIGGCDVAPLRFWIRADLERLITSLTSREVFRSLEESNSISSLYQELNMICAQRWLTLRRRRTVKGNKAITNAAKSASQAHNEVEHLCEVGDVVSVIITHVSGRTLSVVTSRGEGGRIDLSRSEWVAFGYAQEELGIGATLCARVFEIHPVTGVIKFVLENTMIQLESDEVGEVDSDPESVLSVSDVSLSSVSYLNYVSQTEVTDRTRGLGTAERLNALFKL